MQIVEKNFFKLNYEKNVKKKPFEKFKFVYDKISLFVEKNIFKVKTENKRQS